MLFPFFALYVTEKFGVGMTEAGLLLGYLFTGGAGGGHGRRRAGGQGRPAQPGDLRSDLQHAGQRGDGVRHLAVRVCTRWPSWSAFWAKLPAQRAMVADMLPEEQRGEGFGILRIAGNLAWIIGPTIGGVLALRSYMLLFVIDAITSLITAAIVYRLIPETKPAPAERAHSESLLQTVYRLSRRGARPALPGVPGDFRADVARLSTDVQHPCGLSARRPGCPPRLRAAVEHRRRAGGRCSVPVGAQDQALSAHAHDGAWARRSTWLGFRCTASYRPTRCSSSPSC